MLATLMLLNAGLLMQTRAAPAWNATRTVFKGRVAMRGSVFLSLCVQHVFGSWRGLVFAPCDWVCRIILSQVTKIYYYLSCCLACFSCCVASWWAQLLTAHSLGAQVPCRCFCLPQCFRILVVCGIPGSGKSGIFRQLLQLSKFRMVTVSNMLECDVFFCQCVRSLLFVSFFTFCCVRSLRWVCVSCPLLIVCTGFFACTVARSQSGGPLAREI